MSYADQFRTAVTGDVAIDKSVTTEKTTNLKTNLSIPPEVTKNGAKAVFSGIKSMVPYVTTGVAFAVTFYLLHSVDAAKWAMNNWDKFSSPNSNPAITEKPHNSGSSSE